jgi:hypothetical protein
MGWDGGALCVQGRLSCGEVHGKVMARVTDPQFAVAAVTGCFRSFPGCGRECSHSACVCVCVRSEHIIGAVGMAGAVVPVVLARLSHDSMHLRLYRNTTT